MSTDLEACPVCNHPERAEIEAFLMNGGYPVAGQGLFKLQSSVIRRHRDYHMNGKAVAVLDDPMRVKSLAQELTRIAMGMADLAQGDDPSKVKVGEVLASIESARRCVETEAKLTGVAQHADLKTLLPFWHELRAAIIQALEPYPEAHDAVMAAIEAKSGVKKV